MFTKKILAVIILIVLINTCTFFSPNFVFCTNESQYIEEFVKQLKDVPILTEQEFFNHELTKKLDNIQNFGKTSNFYVYCGLALGTLAACGIGYFMFYNKTSTSSEGSGAVESPVISIQESTNLFTIPENEIPETTNYDIIDIQTISSLNLSVEEITDIVFDNFISTVVDDSLFLGSFLNREPQIFELILNNNAMLQEILLVHGPLVGSVVTNAPTLII